MDPIEEVLERILNEEEIRISGKHEEREIHSEGKKLQVQKNKKLKMTLNDT